MKNKLTPDQLMKLQGCGLKYLRFVGGVLSGSNDKKKWSEVKVPDVPKTSRHLISSHVFSDHQVFDITSIVV